MIFILFKNKKRIFRQLVLNYLLQTALVCHRGMSCWMFAYTLWECKILILPKFNQICSILITFAQMLLQIFPNFILISHKSNLTCPNITNFLQKKKKFFFARRCGWAGKICPNVQNVFSKKKFQYSVFSKKGLH